MNKKVLVIVCAFNEQEAILNCLESLRSSIRKNRLERRISVVCADNSSTDKTAEIASRFAQLSSGFHYVKIEHCNLCVSRNTYKFFGGFDYIAYVDGDGYVADDWSKTLIGIIDNHTDAHIISGPVFDLESKKENLVWEMYFDSTLYNSDDYLIGANMVFSREILDKVNGFPSFFSVRGDESSLLLRINKLGLPIHHVFDENLIAYNYFTDDLIKFLKTQFADGKRSYSISQLNGTYWKTKLNGLAKLFSLACLGLGLILTKDHLVIGPLFLMASISPFLLRHGVFVRNAFRKIQAPRVLKKARYASVILFSRFLFDAGFLSQFLSRKKVFVEMLDKTEDPIILEKFGG